MSAKLSLRKASQLKEVEALRKELDAVSKRQQGSSGMARDWERAWIEERATCDALQKQVDDLQRSLEAERRESVQQRGDKDLLQRHLDEERDARARECEGMVRQCQQAGAERAAASEEAAKAKEELRVVSERLPVLQARP